MDMTHSEKNVCSFIRVFAIASYQLNEICIISTNRSIFQNFDWYCFQNKQLNEMINKKKIQRVNKNRSRTLEEGNAAKCKNMHFCSCKNRFLQSYLKYQVNNGCQAQGILFLLALNVLISIGSAVLFTYMSYYSCSRVFQGAAGASYTFLIINFALISITKTWKQLPIQFIFLINLFVFVTMLISLVFSVIQSFCGYNICVNGLNELDYYTWFNQSGIRSLVNVSCYADISTIEQQFLELVQKYQSGTTFTYGDQFSILYGWPITFSVLMLVLATIMMIVIYRVIFSCQGCSVTKSDFSKIYFQFSDEEDSDEDEEY